MTQLIWIQFWQNIYLFSKIKYISNTYPCNFTPEYLPKRNGSISVQRLTYKYCNTFTYGRQKTGNNSNIQQQVRGKIFWVYPWEYHYPTTKKRNEVLRH